MVDTQPRIHARRVYPLDARQLSEEQIAVAFAMTSRRPEPFDEIALQVSAEKAEDFHERWVLGYGHASVAEHAVLHMAVENISRLACDTLEDNRLASYTEKSSRYQVIDADAFYTPPELATRPVLAQVYREACQRLFACYARLLDGCLLHLKQHPGLQRREGEREGAYNLRLRRVATDVCRAVLPAATLTNVGATANARVWEHAISKLLSSELAEERELGEELREQGRQVAPTLIKYAEPNEYLTHTRRRQEELTSQLVADPKNPGLEGNASFQVKLLDCPPAEEAEIRLAAALLFRQASQGFDTIRGQVTGWSAERRQAVISDCLEKMGPHDAPTRELELITYTFEFKLDYGAYREFKRHRMQSYIAQPQTVSLGYHRAQLLEDAGLIGEYDAAIAQAEAAYGQVAQEFPAVAQYLATHAHYRRALTQLNLRECYHLFKLRASPQAHESIRGPMQEALRQVKDVHPALFAHFDRVRRTR